MSRRHRPLRFLHATAAASADPSEGGVWSIGETAEAFGLTLRTLRYYDELLRPRIERGRRWYDAKCRLRLELILKAKQLGFSLREMAGFIADASIAGTGIGGVLNVEEIAAHLAKLEKERAALDKTIEELKRVLEGHASDDARWH